MKKRFDFGTHRRKNAPEEIPANSPAAQEQIDTLIEKFESGNLDPNKLNSHQFTIRDEIADFRNRIPKVLA